MYCKDFQESVKVICFSMFHVFYYSSISHIIEISKQKQLILMTFLVVLFQAESKNSIRHENICSNPDFNVVRLGSYKKTYHSWIIYYVKASDVSEETTGTTNFVREFEGKKFLQRNHTFIHEFPQQKDNYSRHKRTTAVKCGCYSGFLRHN